MEVEAFGKELRIALKFGGQKINLHQAGSEVKPNAAAATPGSADLCFNTAIGPEHVVAHLHDCGVAIALGPVERTGALGEITSVYCRDPDLNLIEIASYLVD